MYGLSVGIMSSVSLIINVTIKMEVDFMIYTIIMICLAAGTALLGRPGGMFPKPGEMILTIRKSAV